MAQGREEKREISPFLRKVLAADAYLTDKLVNTLNRILAFRQLKTHYSLLEISCHGIPWLACWLAFIWILNSKSLYQMQVNFFIGFMIDIFVIAILKSIARRRRPSLQTKNSYMIGPDKYSFPSGHCSRSAFILFFFLYLWPVHFIFWPPLICWTTCVCISRVMMRRHYLLDVFVGILLGILNASFMSLIYLEESTCLYLISWITDEKLDGGEYHV